MIDKCRAEIAGTAGEYHYDCPLDRLLLRFTGITAADFRTMVATGADDEAAGRWLAEHSRTKSSLLIGLWTLWWRCWPPFLFLEWDDRRHERKAEVNCES